MTPPTRLRPAPCRTPIRAIPSRPQRSTEVRRQARVRHRESSSVQESPLARSSLARRAWSGVEPRRGCTTRFLEDPTCTS